VAALHPEGAGAAPEAEAAGPRRRLRVDGKGRSRRDVTVHVGEEHEVVCGLERLVPRLPAARGAPCVALVPDTQGFRHLASSQVTEEDHVLEVGSSTGLCTSLLHAQAASVVGFDVSLAQIEEARRSYPDIRFEFLNIFEEQERLRAMPEASACTACFLDIGGDREASQVVHAVELLRRHCLPRLRLLAVRSSTRPPRPGAAAPGPAPGGRAG